MLAKCGVQVLMSDLFDLGGNRMLDGLELPKPYEARIDSLRRVMDLLDFEIDIFAKLAKGRLAKDPGYPPGRVPGPGRRPPRPRHRRGRRSPPATGVRLLRPA